MLKNFEKFTWKGNKENNFILKDLTIAIRFFQSILNRSYLWDMYFMKSGETFENISYKFYGTTDYWWIIMLSNDMFDYINDIPKDGEYFIEYCCEKYNIEYDTVNYSHLKKLDRILYYKKDSIITHIGDINDFSYIVKDEREPPITIEGECPPVIEEIKERNVNMEALGNPVTILQHEEEINKKKRYIRIVNSKYIEEILSELYRLTQNENN